MASQHGFELSFFGGPRVPAYAASKGGIEMCRRHCEGCGLGAQYVQQFVR